MQALAPRLAVAPQNPWPTEPVPITLAITDLDVGGAERALVALALGLDRSRWRPSLVCLGPQAELVEPLRAAGIPTTCLDIHARQPIQALTRVISALRRQRPALIQSFLFHANFLTRLAAPWAGRPWVLGGLRVAERQREWHLMFDGLTQHLTCGQVCVSYGVERYSRLVGRLPPERLAVIPNGVDPQPFDEILPADRTLLGIPTEAHLALYVGRLDPQKGLPILLEAAQKACYARADWHLALVGDGPLRASLHEQTRELGLEGRVHWLGRRTDVPSLMRSADLLVLPSLWEGMPNVVLEAMAARRAVIGTRVEGTEELVVPGETGWLVAPNDVDALAGALLDAASNRDRLTRFGEAGRTRVETGFTPARVVQAYELLWSRVLGLRFPGS